VNCVIERVFVVVLLGISILFMLVVLISLLRESLNANGRIEGLVCPMFCAREELV
jgi:hypothetical protein